MNTVGEFIQIINMYAIYMYAYVGEFSFVYKAHLLKQLTVMQNVNNLNNHEGVASCSPLAIESISDSLENIVAVKALKGDHNQTTVSPLGLESIDIQYSPNNCYAPLQFKCLLTVGA